MFEALVARVRYHIQKANFMGLKEAESTLLLAEAADAIEQLIEECDAYRKARTDEHNRAAKLAWEKEHCWIPVDERLPKEAGKYLVCGRWRGKQTEIWVCEFMALGYLKGWANNAANPSISHWMPLPEPPKEE